MRRPRALNTPPTGPAFRRCRTRGDLAWPIWCPTRTHRQLRRRSGRASGRACSPRERPRRLAAGAGGLPTRARGVSRAGNGKVCPLLFFVGHAVPVKDCARPQQKFLKMSLQAVSFVQRSIVRVKQTMLPPPLPLFLFLALHLLCTFRSQVGQISGPEVIQRTAVLQ